MRSGLAASLASYCSSLTNKVAFSVSKPRSRHFRPLSNRLRVKPSWARSFLLGKLMAAPSGLGRGWKWFSTTRRSRHAKEASAVLFAERSFSTRRMHHATRLGWQNRYPTITFENRAAFEAVLLRSIEVSIPSHTAQRIPSRYRSSSLRRPRESTPPQGGHVNQTPRAPARRYGYILLRSRLRVRIDLTQAGGARSRT